MGQFIGLVFGLWTRWRPNGWEVTTSPRKFTIISTECTRMRARDGGRGMGGGDRETVSRRFQIILAFSLRFLSSFLSPLPPGPKLLFFPATFKLCYLFTEFFPYFLLLLLLLRPSIESYSKGKDALLLKLFPLPSFLLSNFPDFRLSQFIRS